jgi:hypothetical protein
LEEAAAALKSREKQAEAELAALCETAARDRVKYLSRLKDTRDVEIDAKILKASRERGRKIPIRVIPARS